jgi:hypothetical protein
MRVSVETGFFLREFICESSSVGRARPCQGRGRGFESRLSLNMERKFHVVYGRPDGGIGRHAGLKILWLRGCAGSSPAPGTSFWK